MRMKASDPKTRQIPVRAELVEAPVRYAIDETWPDQPFDRLRANGTGVVKDAGNVDQALVGVRGHFLPASRTSVGVSL